MIGRLREYARNHGVRATVGEGFQRLAAAVYSDHRITLLIKDLDSINEPRKGGEVRIEDLDRGHLAGLSGLNRRRRRRRADRRFAANLERGLHGFVGLRGDEAVAYYWWVEGERAAAHPDLAWLGPVLEIEPGDVYGSDFYVLPEYRQGGTANALLFQIETALAGRGFKRIWGYVDAGNSGARWTYSSRGYRPIAEVNVRKVFFHRRTAPAPPVGSAADE
jgi:GNAT superfamily N-acetyltransferase